MVLLPCGSCCCNASEPFVTLGNPTSIEVDIVHDADETYSCAGTINQGSYFQGAFSGTATIQPATGTYSLALVSTNLWEYEDSDIWISFQRASELQTLTAVPKVSYTGIHTVFFGTFSYTADGATGASVLRNCTSGRQNRYSSTSFLRRRFGENPQFFGNAVGQFGTTAQQYAPFGNLGIGSSNQGNWDMSASHMNLGRVGAFNAECRLPFTFTSRVGIAVRRNWSSTWTESANSFPLKDTPTPVVLNDYIVLYYFEYQIEISACRLIYPSLTLPHMETIHPVCEGFSWV